MVTKKEITRHYDMALEEIGEVKPWWSEEDDMYIFEHPAYPFVDYAAKTPEEVITNYKLVLFDFIRDRLVGNLADSVEKITLGRGGRRDGAGRPKGTTSSPSRQVRLPVDIANWLKSDPCHVEEVRKLMNG